MRRALSKATQLIFILALIASPCSRAHSGPLQFVKKIGGNEPADHYGWMSYVSFSQDGMKVAGDGQPTSDGSNSGIGIWSFPKGKFLGLLPGFPSPNWKFYATPDGVSRINSERPIIEAKYDEIAFSPDSRYVALSKRQQGDGNAIQVFELSTGKKISAFGNRNPQYLAISPDERILAAGYWDVVVLWDLATGKRLAALRGVGRYAQSLAFSQDGKFLAIGTDTGGLHVWNVPRRRKVFDLEIGGGYVSEPAFSRDSKLVAVGVYGTGDVWLISLNTGKIVDHQHVSDLSCGSVAFSLDGQYLITTSNGGLITWPYDKGGSIRVFKVNSQ